MPINTNIENGGQMMIAPSRMTGIIKPHIFHPLLFSSYLYILQISIRNCKLKNIKAFDDNIIE